MNSLDEQILKRIEETKELISKVVNKTTLTYLKVLKSLKEDYEAIKDNDNACIIADTIIYTINHNDYDNKYILDIDNMLLSSYDTKARNGDFKSYCIALEWKRPIHKQYFLPRMKLLERHGVVQAFQDLQDDKLDLMVLNLPPRVGKLLADDTPVLTTKGWKNHGDIIVGDIVFNHKGESVKVLGVSEPAFTTHTITFANNTQIDCHENHEWLVYDRHVMKNRVLETKYIMNNLHEKGGRNRFLLPKQDEIRGENICLPIKPYTLGAWLGDGTNTKPCITIDKKDECIKDRIIEDGYVLRWENTHSKTGVMTYSFDTLRYDLQKEDMCKSRETTIKHIPEKYMVASLEQRLELLAGLLDTDGTLRRYENRYSFSTINDRLKDDFVALVSTFGWRATVVKNIARTSTSGITGRHDVWTISFNPTFYIPCVLPRKQLHTFSKQRKVAIVDISRVDKPSLGRCIQVEGGIYLAGKQLTPTHNSTLSLFFLSFRAGLYPDESILGNGHSTSLTQSFYNELINILTGEEYRYIDIFNNGQIVSKSAEYAWVDLGKDKRFHTLNFKSVDGGTTGLVEASNLLYCDDLVKDVETANNPERLEKLYYTYTSTIKDRKVNRLCKDGVYRTCPELHVNTPWSINDPTNRVIRGEMKKGNNDRVRIISIPCWNDNKESNFLYDYGKGFDTKYYEDMEQAEDPVIFSAKYLMKCIEREGRPFTEDQLNFFYELPDEKPDRIISYSDVSFGGDDYFSMPIAYVYDHDVYIEDVFFVNKIDPDISRPRVCNKIKQHKVERAGFEQNNGGMLYATLIEGDLKRQNYRCNITTHNAPSNSSKRDRILACQSEIKGIATEYGNYRIFFKEYSKRKDNPEYCAFMSNIYNWSQKAGSIQTKQHDDAPDSIAGMIINLLGVMSTGKAQSRVSRKQLGY